MEITRENDRSARSLRFSATLCIRGRKGSKFGSVPTPQAFFGHNRGKLLTLRERTYCELPHAVATC
jgi:hypothetical protein